jgi:hypothetical protein
MAHLGPKMQHGGILGLQVSSWLLCSIVLLFDKYYSGIKVQLSFGRFLKVIDVPNKGDILGNEKSLMVKTIFMM